jgi:ubiquinone/menaquinone biosynthesis C-methylase UbiE
LDHSDHVELLRRGVPSPGGVWADFGAGSGAFTLALAELVGEGGSILAVDKDRRALLEGERAAGRYFPGHHFQFIQADFTRPLTLPPLDGAVMANSLHFVRDKEPLIRRLMDYLKPEGRFILVEYNADRGNYWVPHPLSYGTWERLAARCGFTHTTFLHSRPSRFLGEIYSAVSVWRNAVDSS